MMKLYDKFIKNWRIYIYTENFLFLKYADFNLFNCLLKTLN